MSDTQATATTTETSAPAKALTEAPAGSSDVFGDRLGAPRDRIEPTGRTSQMRPEVREKYAAMFREAKARGETLAPDSGFPGETVVPLGVPSTPPPAQAAAPVAAPVVAAPVIAAPAVAAPALAPPVVPQVPAAVQTPPALPVPPDLSQAWKVAVERGAAAAARELELDAREQALVAREKSTLPANVPQRLILDPVAAVTDLVKLQLGPDATDAEIAEEVAYITTEMSFHVGGIPMPADDLDKLKTRKQLKKLQIETKEARAERERASAEAKRIQEEASAAAATIEYNRRGIAAVTEDLAPVLSKYPYLAHAENPNQMIWDMARAHYERTDQKFDDIEEYAKVANEHIKREVGQIGSRFQSLLSQQAPAPAGAAASPSAPAAPQQDHQSRSRAPEAPPDAPPTTPTTNDLAPRAPVAEYDREAYKAESIARMKRKYGGNA